MTRTGIFKGFLSDPFNKTLLTLAVPIMLQYLINSSLNLVDMVMVGSLGEKSIAAVGFCNVIFFLIQIALFGISSGTSVFMAQFWGAKDIRRIKHVQGFGLTVSVVLSLLVAAAAALAPEGIMRIFTEDEEAITLGISYLTVVWPSYIAMAVSLSFSAVLRSTEKVAIPAIASLIALSINTFLNWVFIFGMLGAPALGVKGVAVSAFIARVLEAMIIIFIVYKKRLVAASAPRELFSFSFSFLKRVTKTTLPVFLNECLWSLGTSAYIVVYGHMGTNIAAAANISATVERMAWIAILGLGNSAAIMIGKKIGEGESDTAHSYGKRFMKYTVVVAAIISALLFMINPHALKLFKIEKESIDIAFTLMSIFATFFIFRSLSYMSCVGILRSGGDVKFCLTVDIISIWFVGVPLAALMGLVWKLPVAAVFITVNAEDVLKFIPYLLRYRSKKWIKNLTRR